jgi:sRNA-binding protein
LKALELLRDLLGDLPAVFPTEDDRRIRPLAIGIDQPLVALAVERGAEADQAAAAIRQVLRRYCRSGAYLSALNQPEALRHALNGTPGKPVAAAHKVPGRPKPKAHQLPCCATSVVHIALRT